MDMDPIETNRYKGHTITLHRDPDPSNPREEDTFGHMACWHRRYTLGDTHPFHSPEQFDECLAIVENSGDDVQLNGITSPDSFLEEAQGTPTPKPSLEHFVDQLDPDGATKVVSLSLYLYDHSGITMRTRPFDCSWDSGQVGYIYVDRAAILREYGGIRLTPALEQQAIQRLKSEVQAYSTYIEGDIVGYQITKGGEVLDSCWGFDDHTYALQEARSAVDYLISSRPRTPHRTAQHEAIAPSSPSEPQTTPSVHE